MHGLVSCICRTDCQRITTLGMVEINWCGNVTFTTSQSVTPTSYNLMHFHRIIHCGRSGIWQLIWSSRLTNAIYQEEAKNIGLTADDANALLHTLAELQAQLDEEDEDLPTDLISGLQQLRRKLAVTGIPVHWHCPCSKCLTHCRLIPFSLAHSIL